MAIREQDILGNVVTLTGTDAKVKETISYEVFGLPTIKDEAGKLKGSSISPFLFTARENQFCECKIELKPTESQRFGAGAKGGAIDSEIGLYHYRARAYSPVLGRFLQMDPIDLAAGDLNLYRYVWNSPVFWRDSYGLRPGGGITDFGGSKTGGGNRGLSDGPRYGNWGGKNWSGGEDGQLDPVDSSDECYKAHDLCYAGCDDKSDSPTKICGKSRTGVGPSEKKQCIKKCDSELKSCLANLSKDPAKWPSPPPEGESGEAGRFRDAANIYF